MWREKDLKCFKIQNVGIFPPGVHKLDLGFEHLSLLAYLEKLLSNFILACQYCYLNNRVNIFILLSYTTFFAEF